jgi:hypothetical protein
MEFRRSLVRPSTMSAHDDEAGVGSQPPLTLRDNRAMIWFFSWFLSAGAICIGTVVVGLGTRAGQSVSFTLTGILATFACLAMMAAPWWWPLGIRCKQCRKRIGKAQTECRGDGYRPLCFYCPQCNVIWETGLVSGPGSN